MDPHVYKNEIDRLTKEITSLKDNSEPMSTTTNILSYKYYFLVFIISGLLIYIVKPKCVLTIYMDEDDEDDLKPEIVVSKKHFFLCWLATSVVSCLIYYIFTKYKKE